MATLFEAMHGRKLNDEEKEIMVNDFNQKLLSKSIAAHFKTPKKQS